MEGKNAICILLSAFLLSVHLWTSSRATHSLLIFAEEGLALPSFLAAHRWHAEDLPPCSSGLCFSRMVSLPSLSPWPPMVGLGLHTWMGWAGGTETALSTWSGRSCWLCSAQWTAEQVLSSLLHPQPGHLLPVLLSRPTPKPKLAFSPPTDSLFSGLCGFLNSPSSQKNGHQLYFLLCYLSPTSQISLAFISHSFLLCFKGCHRRQWGSPWTARLSLKAALSGWCQTGSVCGWARSQGWVLLGCTSGTAGHRAQHTSGAACTLPVPVQVLRQRFMGWWCSIGSTGMGLTFLSDYNSCCHWYPCPHSLFLVSSFLVLFHSHFDSCPQEQH